VYELFFSKKHVVDSYIEPQYYRVDPINPNVLATHEIKFKIETPLLIGSVIRVSLPTSSTPTLADTACKLVDIRGVSFYKACSYDSSTRYFTYSLPMNLDLGTAVTLSIYNVRTSGVETTTDSITIQTLHSGKTVDMVPSFNAVNMKFTTGVTVNQFDSSSISFDYLINSASQKNRLMFTVTVGQGYQSTCKFILKFPSVFYRNLGNEIVCYDQES